MWFLSLSLIFRFNWRLICIRIVIGRSICWLNRWFTYFHIRIIILNTYFIIVLYAYLTVTFGYSFYRFITIDTSRNCCLKSLTLIIILLYIFNWTIKILLHFIWFYFIFIDWLFITNFFGTNIKFCIEVMSLNKI